MEIVQRYVQEHPDELAEAYRTRRPLSRLEVEVRLDWRCNAKCKFCGVWKYSREGMLDIESWQRIFTDLRASGLAYVLFTGGEPMLYPNFLAIIEFVDNLGVQSGIITNGSLLDAQRVGRLAKLRHLRNLTVSLDSPDEATHDEVRKMRGLFRRAMDGMALVREQLPDVTLTINTVVTADTAETVRGLLELPVLPDRLRVFPVGLDMPWLDSLAEVTDNGWAQWAGEAKTQQLSPRVWDETYAKLREMAEHAQSLGVTLEYERMESGAPFTGYCVVPQGHLVLQPDGDAYPCCHVQDLGNRIGRLGEQTVSEMFDSAEYRGFLDRLRPATLPACRSCSRYRAFNHAAVGLLSQAGVLEA